jgi:predicted RNase H-like HicB family nuclease
MVTATEVQTLEFRIVRQVKTTPPLTFTVEMRYSPEDKGYIADCYEMEAFAWGETVEEAVENLLDVLLGFAEVLVETRRNILPCVTLGYLAPISLFGLAQRKP